MKRNHKSTNSSTTTQSYKIIVNSAEVSEQHTVAQLKLLAQLHQVLEPRELIHYFYERLSTRFKISGLRFYRPNPRLLIRCGHSSASNLEFLLQSDDKLLGKIIIARDKAWSNYSLKKLKLYLQTMVQPLRNAMTYQLACAASELDPLTGTANRSSFNQRLNQYIHHAKKRGQDLSVLIIDLDNFKKINDTYGHMTGDTILKRVTHAIVKEVRATDGVFRIGGEEFFVTLNKTDKKGAEHLAERIRNAVANVETHYQQRAIHVTSSIGIAGYDLKDTEISLFEKADKALYKAKHKGGNKVCS